MRAGMHSLIAANTDMATWACGSSLCLGSATRQLSVRSIESATLTRCALIASSAEEYPTHTPSIVR